MGSPDPKGEVDLNIRTNAPSWSREAQTFDIRTYGDRSCQDLLVERALIIKVRVDVVGERQDERNLDAEPTKTKGGLRMGAIVGFALGYYLGCRDGSEGFQRLRDSWDFVSKSDEFRTLMSGAATFATSALKQGLSAGGRGGLAEGVVDMLSRRRAA
jgi:hypothetical protein